MAKARELTYRTRPENPRYVQDMAARLVGHYVVIRSKGGRWMRARLTSVGTIHEDEFTCVRNKKTYKLNGLWRIHNQGLFTEGDSPRPRGELEPIKTALSSSSKGRKIARSNQKDPQRRGGRVPTKAKAAKASKSKSQSNGRAPALTVAQLRQAAKLKLAGSTWAEVREELGVSTSSGRFHELWQEHGIKAPEVRERSAPGSGKSTSKTSAAKKGAGSKPASKAKGKKPIKVTRGKGAKSPS